MDNQTRQFLGPEYGWSKASIELEDVQALHGGVKVYVPRWTAHQMFVTQVMAGGQETKYRIPLGWQEKDELCRLFIEQDFLTIQLEERPGIPDEARPRITLTNSQRETHTVAKWAGVVDARFDMLYQTLKALAERSKDHKPIPAKFKLWQKVLVIAGLVAALLMVLLLAYGVSQALVTAWWPERITILLGLLFLLFIGAPVLTRVLAWQERKKSREDRLFSSSPVALVIWFLFLLAIIGCGEIVWAGLKTLWGDTSLTANDAVRQYAIFAYSALFALYLVAIAAALIGPRALNLVDERF
jgi:hypothetical protein